MLDGLVPLRRKLSNNASSKCCNLSKCHRAVAREFIPTLLTDSAPSGLIDEVTAILSDFHPAGQRALIRAGFAEHDLRDVLPRIDVPTLLLYGDQDVRSPLTVAEEMHARIPGSMLVFLPGVGHMIDVEAPELFNSEVRSFLKSLQN